MSRLLPPMLVLLCSALMGALTWLWPLAQLVVFPWNLVGIVIMAVGLGLAVVGSRLFAKRGTNIHTFRDPTKLVTDGVFRFSRNPMYLGFVILLLGFGILLGSLAALLVVVGFWIVTDRWYVAFEEQRLHQTFGAAYAEYCQQTRRWF